MTLLGRGILILINLEKLPPKVATVNPCFLTLFVGNFYNKYEPIKHISQPRVSSFK